MTISVIKAFQSLNGGNSLKDKILILSLGLVASFSYSAEVNAKLKRKSLCGSIDLRERTYDPKIARVRMDHEPAGCTVTMIGRSCALTAGHCEETLGIAEFNLPDKRNPEEIANSSKEQTYLIDETSLVSKNQGHGSDWAVVRLKNNEITGKLAGDVQGHYEVGFDEVIIGEKVTIKGHGYADDPMLSFSQLGHTGAVTAVHSGRLEHRVDTTGGSSGSSIVRNSDNKIIGIHTHGGCYPTFEPILAAGGSSGIENFFSFWDFYDMPNSNAGTAIKGNKELETAITDCLAWEKVNLDVEGQLIVSQQTVTDTQTVDVVPDAEPTIVDADEVIKDEVILSDEADEVTEDEVTTETEEVLEV